jgi:hypothetical protein
MFKEGSRMQGTAFELILFGKPFQKKNIVEITPKPNAADRTLKVHL